jgi:hypothetical protein
MELKTTNILLGITTFVVVLFAIDHFGTQYIIYRDKVKQREIDQAIWEATKPQRDSLIREIDSISLKIDSLDKVDQKLQSKWN